MKRIAFLFASILLISNAHAVVGIQKTVADLCHSSTQVCIYTIVSIDAPNAMIVARSSDVIKGGGMPQITLRITQPIEVVAASAEGQPIVIFDDGKQPLVHIANRWVIATLLRKGASIWDVLTPADASFNKTFPGTTAALVRALDEIKLGKSTLLDKFDGKVFAGQVSQLGKVAGKPAYMISADLEGNKKPLIILATDKSVMVLAITQASLTDVTGKWGLTAAVPAPITAEDFNGDGKIDLLIGDTFWINDGQKLTASPNKLDTGPVSGLCALYGVDMNNDKKIDVLALKKNGDLLTFENMPAAEKPWPQKTPRALWQPTPQDPYSATFGNFGDQDTLCVSVLSGAGLTMYPVIPGTALDFDHLTGERINNFNHAGPGAWFENAQVIGLNANNDNHSDLLISGNAMLLLYGRGFGAYLPNPNTWALVKTAPVLKAANRVAAIKLGDNEIDDLVMVSEEGVVTLIENAPGKNPTSGPATRP